MYCLVLLGNPIGHAGLLGIHLITSHGVKPLTTRMSERIRQEMMVGWQDHHLGETAADPHSHSSPDASGHQHPGMAHGHGPAAPMDERAAKREHAVIAEHVDPHTPQSSKGQHEHGGLVHSHEPELAERLATLTAKLSDHYVGPETMRIEVVVSHLSTEWSAPLQLPSVFLQVEIPPPRDV